MSFDQEALCKQAAMLESMEFKEYKFHPAFLSKLETLLLDVYASLLPSDIEYEQRKKLVQFFNKIANDTFGDTGGFPEVVAFGSFIMNLFTAKSDLDLSINLNSGNTACLPRNKVVFTLRKFAKVLRKKQSNGLLSRVSQIMHAKVPVLKAVDSETGIECDISLENKDGISISLFFSIISSIDERFRIMSYLMKAWAKANGINSSRHHTMNSLSIISLVALHFQTRDPPILPPFSTLLRDGTDITNLSNVVPEFSNFAKRNTESVAELFVALLAKITSVEKLWELGLCASNFEGSWISKAGSSKFGSKINVEDFLNRTQNFARSVGKSKMPKIYNCLRGSLGYLSSSMQGHIEESALRTLLFGSISNPTIDNTNAGMITHIQPHVGTINSSNHANRATEMSLERNPISNKSGQHHANTNPVLIKNQKHPIKSIQPLVEIFSQSNHVNTTSGMSRKRKKKSTKSTQPCVNTIPQTNLSHINIGMTRNPKHPRIEVIEPQANSSTPALKLPNQTLANIIKPKLPIQHHVESIASKRPFYTNAAGNLPLSSHEKQSYICYPNPFIPPGLSYVPPQYGIIHSNISGYRHPLAANIGHLQSYQQIQYPFANDLASASQYRPSLQYEQMVPVSSNMIQYFPNPWHPISLDIRHPSFLPDYAMYNNHITGHPQFIPSRPFGSNHP